MFYQLQESARKMVPLVLTGSLLFSLSPAGAQELVVETPDPENPEITIVLDGTLQILTEGHVRAATSQAPAEFCPDTGSCEGVAVDLNAFSADGGAAIQVYQGDTIQFEWNTLGARSCTAGGDLPGWTGEKAIQGPENVTLAADLAPGLYSASLQCQNGTVDSGLPQEVEVDVLEFVGDPEAPEHCDASRSLPATWQRLESCIWNYRWEGNCRTFQEIWGEDATFASGGISKDLGVQNSKNFISIAISTNGMATSETGTVLINDGLLSRNARKLISISTCPGDFNETAIDNETGCYMASTTNNLYWGGTSTSRLCKLQSDQTYFLNIVYTDSALGTPNSEIEPNSLCDDGNCGTLVSP